jgi:hypothetical protein
MPDPVRQVLSWAACSVAPSARVVSARGMRAGGNPWLLRLADADGTDEVVLKTGDVTTDLDRRQLGLELRTRALYDVDFAGWRKSAGTSQLLAMAGERIARLPVPDAGLVFVHGDLWLGNTIWSGDSCSGIIGWDAAGAGSPGIDLGTLRLDVAYFSDQRRWTHRATHQGRARRLPARCWPDGSKRPAVRPSTSRTGTWPQPCARWATWPTACRVTSSVSSAAQI